MASAEQIKALLKPHMDGDDEPFFSVAMQAAAHEVRVGHGKLAVDRGALVDRAKNARSTPTGRRCAPGSAEPRTSTPVQSAWPKGNEDRHGGISLTSTKVTALP